jgi:hypothetical protein
VRAAGCFAPTAAYDAALALTVRERRWRPLLVERGVSGQQLQRAPGGVARPQTRPLPPSSGS